MRCDMNLYIPPELAERMDMAKREHSGISWSKITRRAIELWLDELDRGTPHGQVRLKTYLAKARRVTTVVYEDSGSV